MLFFDVGLSLKDVIQNNLSHESCRICLMCTYKWSVDEMTIIKALCLKAHYSQCTFALPEQTQIIGKS